jgi:hypothetical protein
MFKQLLQYLRKDVRLVKYPEPMSAERVQQIFKEQGKDSNIWQALDTVIDQQLLDAVNECSDAKLNNCGRAHAAGRIDAISTLKGRVEEFK